MKNNPYDDREFVEITYSVFGYDEAGETTFEWSPGKGDLQWMEEAEDEGELLDSDYISESNPQLHGRILKTIRKNMEELGEDDDDGMVARPYASLCKDFHPSASHMHMHEFADEDDVEYSVVIL